MTTTYDVIKLCRAVNASIRLYEIPSSVRIKELTISELLKKDTCLGKSFLKPQIDKLPTLLEVFLH